LPSRRCKFFKPFYGFVAGFRALQIDDLHCVVLRQRLGKPRRAKLIDSTATDIQFSQDAIALKANGKTIAPRITKKVALEIQHSQGFVFCQGHTERADTAI
jgi:hypothetical protein